MEKSKAIEILKRQIEPIDKLKSKEQGQEFKKWHRDTAVAVERIFGKENRHIKDFDDISYSLFAFTTSTPDMNFIETAKSVLMSFIEYDVQDLFHALLRLYFDDIRDEEWSPSYAGACSRIDFLLKQEQIVIEIKKRGKD